MKFFFGREVSPASAVELGCVGDVSPASAVLAIIVCYEPDRDALVDLLVSLATCHVSTLLIDNSESDVGCVSTRAIAHAFGAEYLCNVRNVGVAEAQNIGLRRARERGLRYALLLDQDTTLEDGALARLIAACESLTEAGQPVAAVGPAFADPRSDTAFPFVRLQRLRMGRVWPLNGHAVECDLLISSGSLIPLSVLDAVGDMDASLFIDYVDIEWCVRARAAGFKVFGVSDARMQHRIGDRSFRLFGRTFQLHNPIRNYYFTRNALLFARKPYLTLRWRIHLLYRVAGQFVLFGLFAPQRFQRLRWMLRGLWDGLLGRGGRLGGPNGHGRRRGTASEAAQASGLARLSTARD